MARATEKADAAVLKLVKSYGQFGVESKVISAAAAGASDSALKLLATIDGGAAGFGRIGAQGAAAFREVGAASETALQSAQDRILVLAEKVRQVKDQAATLTGAAVAQNAAGTLSDDGLKLRLAEVRAVQKAELERIATVARADADARRAAQAERVTAARGAQIASTGASTATSSAQAQVYAAFLLAQAAAAERVAQAEARQAEVSKQVAAASDRARTAQQAAYETKTAFIARVNEEAAALFRTRDAQAALDAQRAGVSAQQSAQLAKFSGDRQFIASIYTAIDAEKKLGAEYGKTTAEILRQQAAERGLDNTTASSIARLEQLANANRKVADEAQRRKAAESFLTNINAVAAGINTDGTQKARSDLLALQAAQLGVGKQAEAALAKIALLDGKTGQLGKTAFASRNQLLTLQYTISDVIASAGSGISPLTILLQQGPQLAQIEGGLSGVFRTALSVITPFRVAIGGTVAALGTLAAAYVIGSKESRVFADSIVLSGNFAGQTEGKFNALAEKISSSTRISTGAARDFAQELIRTGEIGPKVFDASAEAAARYGAATGKSAKDVAAEFALLAKDVTAGATKMNASLNFLSAAQMQQIRLLQEQGKDVDAYRIAIDALNTRLPLLEGNLGTLERTTQSVGKFFKDMWDRVLDVGRTETIEQKLKSARAALIVAQRRAGDAPSIGVYGGPRPAGSVVVDKAANEVNGLLREKGTQDAAAIAAADAAALQKRASAADAFYAAAGKGAKLLSARTKELAEEERSYQSLVDARSVAKARGDAQPALPSDAERAAIQKKIRDAYVDKGAISDNSAERRAQLDLALKVLQDNLAAQQDALKFNQSVLAADYSASNISLQDYYAQRASITAKGTEAELSTLVEAEKKIRAEIGKGGFKNAAEKTQYEKILQEAIGKRANVERDADDAAKLALKDQEAAYKSLNREVLAFQATVAQAQGDEAGAAAKRLQQLVKDAQDFQKRSGGLVTPEQVEQLRAATQQTDALVEVQRRLAVATSDAGRAEEIYLLASSKAGLSLEATERGVFAIRSQLLEQLRVTAERTQALAVANVAAAEKAGQVADPRLLAAAADAALSYAKALETVDPALNRVREKTDALANSLAQSAVSSVFNFGDAYRSRVERAQQETAEQRKAQDAQLAQLRQFLAQSNDARERARLQDLIKQAEANKKGTQVSKTEQVLKTLERDVFGPLLKQIQDAAVAQFITEPLQKYLKDAFRGSLEGDGILAKLFPGSAKSNEQAQQTLAITASTNALTTWTNALASSTAAVSGGFRLPGASGDPAAIKLAGAGVDQSGENYDHEFTRAFTQSTESADKLASGLATTKFNTDQLNATLPAAAALVDQLGIGSGRAGQALSLLPRIIQLIQAAGTTSAASGFNWSSIIGLFGGSGMSTNTTGTSLPTAGGRAGGGAVPAGALVEVAEGGRPELLRFGNKTMLINGSQDGYVTPIRPGASGGGWGAGGNTYVTVEDHAGGKVTTEEKQMGQDKMVRIIIEQTVAEVDKRIARGGSTADALKATGLKLNGGNGRRD